VLIIDYNNNFLKIINKIKNKDIKNKIKKQIKRIIENPEIGKPMKYQRKNTRELYFGSYRIAYSHIIDENKLVFLDIYHKDEQ
jgi:mRNA-degrading endonuclease RelE of RelBE toxin-antitoxin system